MILGIIIIYMFLESMSRHVPLLKFFITGMIYCAEIAISITLYYIIALVMCKWSNTVLSGYSGIGSLGENSISIYFSRIKLAYIRFFNPIGFYNNFVMRTKYLYFIILILSIMIIIVLIIHLLSEKQIHQMIEMLIFTLIFPLAVNILYIINDEVWLHSLTSHSQILILVLFTVLLEKLFKLHTSSDHQRKYITTIIKSKANHLSYSLLCIMAIMFIRYANICYLEAILNQQELISWETVLIAQIKSVEGYQDDMPVAFVNRIGDNWQTAMSDKNVFHFYQFDEVTTVPYTYILWSNTSWQSFMKHWCYYYPEWVEDVSIYEEMEVVQNMPSYPDDGSIQIIDNVIVVKF